VREGTERGRRVLVVEDDGDIASLLTDILETEGYEPVAIADARDLDGKLEPRPHLVVLDLRLTRGGAEEIIVALRKRGLGDVPVLLLSAAGDLADRARELGVTSYLEKPFELDDLLVIVRQLI